MKIIPDSRLGEKWHHINTILFGQRYVKVIFISKHWLVLCSPFCICGPNTSK
jgi:hypothetical protein